MKKNQSFADIDLDRLEEEWVHQPNRLRKYADMLADAKRDLAEAEAKQEVLEAEVKQSVRRNPSKYGFSGKPTEPGIKEAMILSKKYQAGYAEVITRKHRVDILTGAVNSLEHRKRALESLVTLHGQNYFARPSERKATDSVRDSIRTSEKKSSRSKAFKRGK